MFVGFFCGQNQSDITCMRPNNSVCLQHNIFLIFQSKKKNIVSIHNISLSPSKCICVVFRIYFFFWFPPYRLKKSAKKLSSLHSSILTIDFDGLLFFPLFLRESNNYSPERDLLHAHFPQGRIREQDLQEENHGLGTDLAAVILASEGQWTPEVRATSNSLSKTSPNCGFS